MRAVRPGGFDLTDEEKPGVNNVPAILTNSTYLGNTSQLRLRVGENIVTAITTSAPAAQTQNLILTWPFEAGVLLPEDSNGLSGAAVASLAPTSSKRRH
jgi:hypothetical protein